MTASKIFFKKIDLIIYFPEKGNEGRKYGKYGVAYRNRISGETQSGIRINLENVLKLDVIKNNYPHTIGYFLESKGRGKTFSPKYIENKVVNDEKSLFEFLNKIGI